jgi:phenylacetate-CoA ligase
MSSSWTRFYEWSPVWAQNFLLTVYSARLHRERYGSRFEVYRALLARMERSSLQEIEEYQNERLRAVVTHAYETVPYYRRIFDERGLKPSDINSHADLVKLPLLRRKDILRHFDELRSRAFRPRELRLGHTSGTTGSPLEVYYDAGVIHMTYALMDRQYRWAGVRLERGGDPIAVMRGNVVVPVGQHKPPFWRTNRYHNQLLLSSFHLSPENLPHYVRELERFRPRVVDGYPSTVYVLARYLLSIRRTLPVKAVITSSETLFDFQREAIERAFECRVFDYFAAAERVIFSTECERHEGHHLSSEYGIAEIVDESGRPFDAGCSGLLVGTSLHNFGMPLLRYVMNDISAIKAQPCSCGRVLPLMDDVSTKAEDIIALADGRMISPSVLTHPFKPLHCVEQSQVIQEDYNRVVIKILPNESYKPVDGEYLVREFQARLGRDVQVDIQLVDSFERTRAGKFKWVISKVDKSIKVPSSPAVQG